MTASTSLRREEGIGLAAAVVLHAAVLAALLVRPPHHAVVVPPQRIEVTISDEVGMTSTSPDPFTQAAPDKGPEPGDPVPMPAPAPDPLPAASPLPPEPAPRVIETPAPRPVPKAAPRPAPKAPVPPKPAAKAPPSAQPVRKSSAIDAIVARPGRAAPSAPAAKASAAPKKAGSSSFADAFSQGLPGAKAPTGTGAPAAAIGPKQLSALGAAINRQLKPHWQVPQGAEADLLVTRVRFRLNRDGSLAGDPQVLATTGQTDANRAQVQRHQEQAVRAVKLAAPFSLPEDLYDGWKVVTTSFDRRLSQ